MTNTRRATSTDREVAGILSGGVMLLIPRLLNGTIGLCTGDAHEDTPRGACVLHMLGPGGL